MTEFDYLSWFLGPKSENGEVFFEQVLETVDDYIHWRRNYFPNDKILISKKMQKEYEDKTHEMRNKLLELLSGLKRNFPFYSPRYIAHMLSDTTMPSMLGYMAGMLYNPNNVTPEAAPVTTEWEIDVCNEILEMLGFKPSPSPPSIDSKKEEWDKYERKLNEEFGWSHITSGGTVANLEALWVARTVRYYSLNIIDSAIHNEIELIVKMPNGTRLNTITDNIDYYEILNIQTKEAIDLFAKFIGAIMKRDQIDSIEANEKAIQLLGESKYSVKNHLNKILFDFPPVILVANTAHYSINKAADILGIGQNNVIGIKLDCEFKMLVDDLKEKLEDCYAKKKVPIAIIAMFGTTEEGAVDPIDKIIDLREMFEKNMNKSFWFHIDSAWGGFIRSIMKLSNKLRIEIIIDKICGLLGYKEILKDYTQGILEIENRMYELYSSSMSRNDVRNSYASLVFDKKKRKDDKNEHSKEKRSEWIKKNKSKFSKEDIDRYELRLKYEFKNKFKGIMQCYEKEDIQNFVNKFKKIILDFKLLEIKDFPLSENDFAVKGIDLLVSTTKFMQDHIDINFEFNYNEKIKICWNNQNVFNAILGFDRADSITIDPHKMGYIPYPNGIVAFKYDKVRHFVTHEAPYITSSKQNVLLHKPPRHTNNIYNSSRVRDIKINIDSFSKFTLEGSKPGAAAAALKLTTSVIPLNREGYGCIIRQSLLATLELYEWIVRWDDICLANGFENKYRIVPVQKNKPHTNLLIFVVVPKTIKNIEKPFDEINALTEKVYSKFTIQAEFGAKDFSYSQKFFLSKTTLSEPNYNFDMFENFLFNPLNCDLDPSYSESVKNDYNKNGLLILRATIMNPYLFAYGKVTKQNFFSEFLWELDKCLIV